MAIAHEFPGHGDPFDLPVDVWDAAILAIIERRKAEREAMNP